MTRNETEFYGRFDGDNFIPLHRFKERLDKLLVVNEIYRLQIFDKRSLESHNHYFAELTSAWKNLPENIASRFPTREHFRKWCLIKCGFCKIRTIVCKDSENVGSIIDTVKLLDEFAVVTIDEFIVTIYSAESQSNAHMDKARFLASKNAVLDLAASMIGVTREQLDRERRQHPEDAREDFQ